jgi:hypothetical protein
MAAVVIAAHLPRIAPLAHVFSCGPCARERPAHAASESYRGGAMRWAVMAVALVLAGESMCNHIPAPSSGAGAARPPDELRLRGALDEDVDCRLLRADNGQVYSLSVRLPRYRNGDRVCIRGTLTQNSGCLHSPTIEVADVGPAEKCP